jgi:hypothetical protein
MSNVNRIDIASANGLAEENLNRELSHIRATQQRIKLDAEKRRSQAERDDNARREKSQAALRVEVKGLYLSRNLWASEADFDKAWKADCERLIKEHAVALGSVPRM